jgi:hypothetical protein
LHGPITQKRHTQNSSKGCSQTSWEARSPSLTPLEGSPHGLAMVPGNELLWACGVDGRMQSLHLLYFCFVLLRYQQIL